MNASTCRAVGADLTPEDTIMILALGIPTGGGTV
jgi:hypothetical protein